MEYIVPVSALLPVIEGKTENTGANFMLISKTTGIYYTYKITRKQYYKRWYTHIKVLNMHGRYIILGNYFKGRIYYKKEVVNTKSAQAIAYVLNKVENRVKGLDNYVELRHTGKCLRCGRPLTDSISIGRGLGPVCYKL